MKALLFLTVFWLGTCVAQAQHVPGRYVLEGRFDLFTTDELGNVYALKGDELELFDKRGRSWLRNSLKTFGRIRSIDAFYSLKPMVFSPEQGQLAVLDNTLSLQGSVTNLPRLGYPQVVLACMGVQNSFWFFDERDLDLIRLDGQLRQLAHTGRLDQLLGFTPKPIGMQEFDSRLYLNDPKNGFLVFDIFGTYIRTIPIKNAQSFEVRRDRLYYFVDSTLHVYNMRTFESQPFPMPAGDWSGLRDARVERGLLFMLLPDRLVIQELEREH